MRRPLILLPLCLLAACGGAEEAPEGNSAGGAGPVAEGAERIECAVGGADALAPVCTIERRASAEGLTLTVRAPDGGFRRLLVTKDGRGVVAADGADPARVTPIAANRIDVEIAGDRYRLPATVRQ